MLCIACEGNSSRFGADKNHICPRLINGVVIQGVLATDEPSARRDRWQDAVDAEVAHSYGVVGANFLGSGLGRVFDVTCCSDGSTLECAVHCRICYDPDEASIPLLVFPGTDRSIKRNNLPLLLLKAFDQHCKATRFLTARHHLLRHAGLATGRVRDVLRTMISELPVKEPRGNTEPVSSASALSVVASPAFSVTGVLAQIRSVGGASVYARAARKGLPEKTITIQPSESTMKPAHVLTLSGGGEAWKARVGAEHKEELLLVCQRVASILAKTAYVGAWACGSDTGGQSSPLYACSSTGRLQRLADFIAGAAPRAGLYLVSNVRSRNLLREDDYAWATGPGGSVRVWLDHERQHVASALAAFDEVIASPSVSESDKALARDARADLLSRGFGRLRLPEFVAKFRERAASAPAPSAVPALPPLVAASPAPAAALADLSIDGGVTARGERRDDESLPPI